MLGLLVAALTLRSAPLDIEVGVFPNETVPRIHVEITFENQARGPASIVLPSESFGQTQLYRNIQNLRLVGSPAFPTPGSDPAKVTINQPGRVRLAYDVIQSWTGDLPRNNEFHSGVIDRTNFSFCGESLWVLPDWDINAQHKFSIHWRAPDHWNLANSYGRGTVQNFRASLQELKDSIFAGGDFRVKTQRVQGGDVTVAIRGKDWKFADDYFFNLVAQMVGFERVFWNPHAKFPPFFVMLVPTADEEGFFHGMGKTNGFGMWLPHTTGATTFVKTTVAHEMMHAYTPGPLSDLDPPQWYCEGFTDYYAALLCMKNGVISQSEFLDFINFRLKRYYRSKIKNLTETEESAHRFDSDDNFNLPYWRGTLLAMKWDTRIRKLSGGKKTLTDALRLAMSEARKKQLPKGEAGVLQAIRAVYPPGVDAEVDKYIHKGETIEPDSEISELDVELVITKISGYDIPQYKLRQR